MSWHTECTCEYYYNNIELIDSGLQFLNIHGIKADPKPFIYCPYCGNKLKQIDNQTGREIIDERQLKLL